MKRFFCAILVLMLLIPLASCAKKKTYVWVLKEVTYKSLFEVGNRQYECSADESSATIKMTDTNVKDTSVTTATMPGKVISGDTDVIVYFNYSSTNEYGTISAYVSAYDNARYIKNSKGEDSFQGPETSGYVDCSYYFPVNTKKDLGDHMRLLVVMSQGIFTYDYYVCNKSEADSAQVAYVTDKFLF